MLEQCIQVSRVTKYPHEFKQAGSRVLQPCTQMQVVNAVKERLVRIGNLHLRGLAPDGSGAEHVVL